MSKKTQIEKKKKATHGIYSWLKTGRINPSIRGYKKLQRYLKDMEKDLIDMQGGSGKLTAAKEILIKATIEAYGVLFLASIYCKREGLLRPDLLKRGIVELQPVLGRQFLSFLNVLRQNLVVLGLDSKKADETLDFQKYIELKDKEKEKNRGENNG